MNDEKYKVRHFDENIYEVTVPAYGNEYYYGEGEESVFKGTLTECEAYIRLNVGGYM